jgi:hypothetical protein
MQDVIELRVAGWKARREVAGPKTIDQIREDIEKEQRAGEDGWQAASPTGSRC